MNDPIVLVKDHWEGFTIHEHKKYSGEYYIKRNGRAYVRFINLGNNKKTTHMTLETAAKTVELILESIKNNPPQGLK